jgi:hypothetical protein
VPAAREPAGGHVVSSIEPLNDGAVDGKTTGTELCAARPLQQTVFDNVRI